MLGTIECLDSPFPIFGLRDTYVLAALHGEIDVRGFSSYQVEARLCTGEKK